MNHRQPGPSRVRVMFHAAPSGNRRFRSIDRGQDVPIFDGSASEFARAPISWISDS